MFTLPWNPEFTVDTKSMHSLPSSGITQSKWRNKRGSFAVISDDIKDDVKFVELANSKIDEYYNQKGIVFENEI